MLLVHVCTSTFGGFPVLVPLCSFPFRHFASFAFFLLGLTGPCLHPVCPPVHIKPITISRFAVSLLFILRVCHGRILGRNDYLCPPNPHSRDPLCPKVLKLIFIPINTHLGHSLTSPTYYARHACCCSFWHILPCAVLCTQKTMVKFLTEAVH